MSSSGSSPLARTATHSSMGSSVDARWSARFGVALSVSATCACGAAGERVGGMVRHYPPSGRLASTASRTTRESHCPLRTVAQTSRRRRVGRGTVRGDLFCRRIPAEVHQKLLIRALRFTSPCAVTSNPLLCCSESAAAALRRRKALLQEATAANRIVRRSMVGYLLANRCGWLSAPPLRSSESCALAHAREPSFDSGKTLRLFGHDSLRKRAQTDGIGVRLCVASDRGPIEGLSELSATARVSQAHGGRGKKAHLRPPQG